MARDFDGSFDYLNNTSQAAITSLPVTIACWFNSDVVDATDILMSLGNATNSARVVLVAAGTTAGDPVRAIAYVAGGASGIAETTTGYTAGTWYHAAGVFETTTSRTAYINGGDSGSDTANIDSAPSSWTYSAIGAYFSFNAWSLTFNGKIAEAGVWSAALTADEIGMLAARYSPLLVRPDKLVAYWPLHGRAGSSGDEEDWVGTNLLTPTSPPLAVADHPRIIYPRRRTIFLPASAASGTTPLIKRAYGPDGQKVMTVLRM